MALINCPECNNEVSDKAKTCPNCGYSMRTKNTIDFSNKHTKITKIVLSIFMLGIISGSIILNLPKYKTVELNDSNISEYLDFSVYVSEYVPGIRDTKYSELDAYTPSSANVVIKYNSKKDADFANVSAFVHLSIIGGMWFGSGPEPIYIEADGNGEKIISITSQTNLGSAFDKPDANITVGLVEGSVRYLVK